MMKIPTMSEYAMAKKEQEKVTIHHLYEGLIYDSYSEVYHTERVVKAHLLRYHKWCKDNGQSPEVECLQDVTEDNIGHIVYHSELLSD